MSFFKALPFLFILTLASCASSSLEDVREQGERVNRQLIKEFRAVRSLDDLKKNQSMLKKLFTKVADLMITARMLEEKNPRIEDLPLTKKQAATSEQLRSEMNRVYQIEGARALIEKAQEEGLHQLERA